MNARYRKGPFQPDEAVIFLDRKDREYLARLDQRRADCDPRRQNRRG